MEERKYKICALTTISKTMDWFIVDSMKNLSKNGYEITLVSNMEKDFIERNKNYATCINLEMHRGVSVKDLFRCTIFLVKFFKKEKFDIIYYTSPNVSLYASIAGFLAGVKIRFYSQCGLRYVSFYGIKRNIFKLVEKVTCLFSTTIRAQSPLNMKFALKEKLCKKEKISVVGIGGTIGVSLNECDSFDHVKVKYELRKKYSIPNQAFLYGYVGRINTDKGINELIEAFVKLQKKYKNIYLILIGMLDNTNPIKKENLEIIKANKQIIMTGNIPLEEVYPHMAMFEVLTHPTYREGFGKVLQEAMGVGIPIITTNVPGPSEVIENKISGILVNVRDVEDLLSKMEELYLNKDLREKFANNGRKRAEIYFDRPIMLNNILKDINEVIEKGKETNYEKSR